MKVPNRLASALSSKNLSWDRIKVRDVDYLTALGMAGIKHKAGSAIYRVVRVGDRSSMMDAQVELVKLISRHAKRGHWGLKPHLYVKVAQETLVYLLNPRCPSCKGQRYTKRPGSPCLSSTPCPVCKGSGMRKASSPFVTKLISLIELEESWIIHNVKRRMSMLAADPQ